MRINSKQRAALRSMASHEQAIMQVGREGVGPNLVKSVSDALEARELVKLSVLETCGTDVRETAELLAAGTGAVVVCTIGRKLVLYRESKDHKRIEL